MNNDSFAAPPLVGGMNEQIKSVYAPNEIEMTLLFLIMGWHHYLCRLPVCLWLDWKHSKCKFVIPKNLGGLVVYVD
jgi:hypothetical protein